MSKTFNEIFKALPINKRSFLEFFFSLLFNQPFRLKVNFILGKRFFKSKNPFLRLFSYYLKNKQFYNWSCDISYSANISSTVSFGHPVGIVIGNCKIEKDVKIWQNVTIGSHGKNNLEKDYPYINDGVKIFAGAVIIGGVTIGKNATIAANCVVNKDVPENSIAVGVPCKIIYKNE